MAERKVEHWAKWERMSREEFKALQWQRLKHQLEYLWQSNPYHRKRMEERGITPDDIKTPEDFRKKIPLMYKKDCVEDQEKHPPYGERLGVSPDKVIQVITTSGTSGLGVEVYGFTESDMEIGGLTWALNYHWMGARTGDNIFLFLSVANLAGGQFGFAGCRQLRANCFIAGPFDTKTKIDYMKRFGVNYFMATPPFITYLTTEIIKAGLNPKSFGVKGILFAGNHPISWAQEVEEAWGAKLYEHYGATQLGLGGAFSCERGAVRDGERGCLHLMEHYIYFEVIDPETGEPVKPGEAGAFIITPLYKQASPVLRFDMRDKVVYLPYDYCDCGRPVDAIECGTVERYDDMIKMKAVNVWPAAIEEVIFSYAEVLEYQGRVFVDERGREEVTISVEFKADCAEGLRQGLLQRMIGEVKDKVGVRMNFEEAPEGSLPRFEFKARRWTDDRVKGLEGMKF